MSEEPSSEEVLFEGRIFSVIGEARPGAGHRRVGRAGPVGPDGSR